MGKVHVRAPNPAVGRPRRRVLETVDTIFKLVIAAGTLAIGYLTFQLNAQLNDVKNGLDGRRFSFDQMTSAYDRVDRYLALSQEGKATPQNGEAIILYVRRIEDTELSNSLWDILRRAADEKVRTIAIDNALGDPKPAAQVDLSSFADGVLFARNEGGRSTAAVFVCPNPSDPPGTVELARSVGDALGRMNEGQNDAGRRFGRVTGDIWSDTARPVPVSPEVTLVLDDDEKTSRKGTDLQATIASVVGEVPVVIVDNPDARTSSYYSVIVCI